MLLHGMAWYVQCGMAWCALCYGMAWYVLCGMAWFRFESNDSPLPCHNHRPACPNNTLTPEMKMKGMTNTLIINEQCDGEDVDRDGD